MKKFFFWVSIATLLAAGVFTYDFIFDRAPPHRFVVKLDEPASGASLTLGELEGEVTTELDGGPIKYYGSRYVADSLGEIKIAFLDGAEISCQIRYITNGELEPHLVNVIDRECPEIGAHVQF